MPPRHRNSVLVTAIYLIAMTAQAQDTGFELAFRPMVLASQGEPSNDMLGGGIVLSWPWKQGWYFGAALDNMSFDYERPQNILGIPQDPDLKVIDGSNSFTRLSGHIERRYDRDGRWGWFWSAGLGYASVDADVVTGPTASGGTFNIVTDASDEFHLMSSIGLRRSMSLHWSFSTTFHLEHHLTDYQLRDTVSGATGKIGSHTPVGASVEFAYRF